MAKHFDVVSQIPPPRDFCRSSIEGSYAKHKHLPSFFFSLPDP